MFTGACAVATEWANSIVAELDQYFLKTVGTAADEDEVCRSRFS